MVSQYETGQDNVDTCTLISNVLQLFCVFNIRGKQVSLVRYVSNILGDDDLVNSPADVYSK